MSNTATVRPLDKDVIRVLAASQSCRLLLAGAAAGMLALLAGAFLYAPREAVEGDVQRVFYIHVPMAWVAFMAFFVVFAGSVLFLWRKDSGWDILARSSAEVGVVFTSLVLATGAIWGKPIWGTWWAWDARLTTTLILWVFYAGYLAVRAFAGDDERSARLAAVVGIIAFVDVPVVHFSVLWWRTLHPQPIVVRPLEGPALPGSMLAVLMVGLVAMTLLYLALLSMRVAAGALEAQLRDAARQRASLAAWEAPQPERTSPAIRRLTEAERG